MSGCEVICIATTVVPHRDYREEFLNAFAYPRGHHVFFRYRARWISNSLRTDLKKLGKRQALLFFCEPQGMNSFEFHPVRWCTILDATSESAQPDDEEPIIFRLELGAFVHPDLLVHGAMHQTVRSLVTSDFGHPLPIAAPDGLSAKFVFPRKLPATLDTKIEGEWHSAAMPLSVATTLAGASFMHIRRLREIHTSRWMVPEKLYPVIPSPRPYGLIYSLRYDHSYILSLEYMIGDTRHLDRLTVAPPAAAVSLPFRRFFPNFIRTDVILTPLGTSNARCGLLVAAGNGSSPTTGGDTPRALLMLDIKGPVRRTWFFTAIIGVGLVLQNFAAPMAVWLTSKTGTSVSPDLVKGLGVFISLWGILFGLRQLPNLPPSS